MHENMRNIPMITMNRIKPIATELKKIDTLRQISSVLSWDQETMMPPNGIDARSNQLETLAGLIHDAWQSDDLTQAMANCIDLYTGAPKDDLDTDEKAFVREVYPQWKRNTQLSKSLVQELSKATSRAQHVWQDARKNNAFNEFSPHLQTLIDLTLEKINQLGMTDHPYDTLIDEFEPGMTVKKIDAIFSPLTEKTVDFLNHHKTLPPNSIPGPFGINEQIHYSKELMEQLGYDRNRGRLDVSTHPFTIDIHPTDVRITTRANPDYLFESISSTIHEVGHGLYEQGLDPQWAGTPYGASRSMGVHESQSRLWEIFIGQSLAFWEGQLPRIHDLFPSAQSTTAADFYKACHHIKPHWCRVESDIVTYNLHIVIRYECEKALFSKSLNVNDLPEFWNQKMNEYLGLDITNDTQGCLQDVHWSAGLFGYFPSYTLGTLIANQLHQKLHAHFPALNDMIRTKTFVPIKEWLNQHIHVHGSKMTTSELLNSLGIHYAPENFIASLSEQLST